MLVFLKDQLFKGSVLRDQMFLLHF